MRSECVVDRRPALRAAVGAGAEVVAAGAAVAVLSVAGASAGAEQGERWGDQQYPRDRVVRDCNRRRGARGRSANRGVLVELEVEEAPVAAPGGGAGVVDGLWRLVTTEHPPARAGPRGDVGAAVRVDDDPLVPRGDNDLPARPDVGDHVIGPPAASRPHRDRCGQQQERECHQDQAERTIHAAGMLRRVHGDERGISSLDRKERVS